MQRKIALIEQLQQQIKTMIPTAMSGDKIGSLIFWNDDYGAFITFAPWKMHEFPWSFPNENNIDLHAFDVFDYDEMKVIRSGVEAFYNDLRNDPSFLQLPLRKGFQFCYFDLQMGEPLEGIEDAFKFTLDEAIAIIMQYIVKGLAQNKIDTLEQITFSGEEQAVSMSLSGAGDYDYYSYDDWDIGFAFTTLIQSPVANFYTLCEHLIRTEEFQKIIKNEQVEFQIFTDVEEFFTTNYQVDSGKLVKVD